MTSRSKSVLSPLVLLKRTRPVKPSQWACRQWNPQHLVVIIPPNTSHSQLSACHSINLKVSSLSTISIQLQVTKLFLCQLWIPFGYYLTAYCNRTRINKAQRIEAVLTGKSSLCMWFILLEVLLQSHGRNRRARREIADAGGGGITRYYNGSFCKLPAMIPSTE